jgi:hypothetical protein
MPGRASQIAAEVLRGPFGARSSQIATEVLRGPLGARASQISVEALRPNSFGARTSQISVEVLRSGEGAHLSQVALEVLISNILGAHMSQVATEVLRSFVCGARASQISTEVLRSDVHGARATQISTEVLWAYVAGARMTQIAVEVLREPEALPIRATQLVAEVLRSGDGVARVTQEVGEVLRTGDGLGRVTALVAEVLRTNAPIVFISDTIRVWPFRANAKFDLIERYGYLSEVLRSRNGAEQRRCLRETAGGNLSFTCTLLTAQELQYASALLGDLIGREIAVPQWQYAQYLPATCYAWSTEIPAETAGIPFYPEALVMLWQSPWTWEVFRVLSIGANSLAAVHEIRNSWAARQTILVPLVMGYLAEREEYMRDSPIAGDFPVEFDVPAFCP